MNGDIGSGISRLLRATAMFDDFYCAEALSGRTPVEVVAESANVVAFRHTRPAYPVHVVVTPKRHIASLITLTSSDSGLILELFDILRDLAAAIEAEYGACRVITNLGRYQDSKHLHFHVVSGDRIVS